MIEIKDIKLLSRVWEIKPKPNVKVNENIFYCCKVRIQNSEPIIIYFNNLGRINGWNTIEVIKKSFMLVRIYEAKDQKVRTLICKYLKEMKYKNNGINLSL